MRRWYVSLLVCCLPMLGRAEPVKLVTHEFPPYSYWDSQKGTIAGIATDKLLEVMRRSGQDYSLSLTSWTHAFQKAVSEPNTCVFSAFRTPERENQMRWVGPVMQDNWVFFSRVGDTRKIKSVEDLRPYVIGSFKNAGTGVQLSGEGYKVEFANDNDDNPRLLVGGRIDYWVTSEVLGQYLIDKQGYTGQIVKAFKMKQAELYLACNPKIDKQKIDRFNAILQEMEKDGTNEAITKRYMSK
jgi:polar amino acid transport system substrate-binding protein